MANENAEATSVAFGPVHTKGALVGLPPEIHSIQAAQKVVEALSRETRAKIHWRLAEKLLGQAHESTNRMKLAREAFENALATEGWS